VAELTLTEEYNCRHTAEEMRLVAEVEKKAMTIGVDIHY
jgi:hypothetical protein